MKMQMEQTCGNYALIILLQWKKTMTNSGPSTATFIPTASFSVKIKLIVNLTGLNTAENHITCLLCLLVDFIGKHTKPALFVMDMYLFNYFVKKEVFG